MPNNFHINHLFRCNSTSMRVFHHIITPFLPFLYPKISRWASILLIPQKKTSESPQNNIPTSPFSPNVTYRCSIYLFFFPLFEHNCISPVSNQEDSNICHPLYLRPWKMVLRLHAQMSGLNSAIAEPTKIKNTPSIHPKYPYPYNSLHLPWS